jgi:adenylate cyclase
VSPSVLRRLIAVPLLAAACLGLTVLLQSLDQHLRRSPLSALNREVTDLAFQSRDATQQDSLWALQDVVIIGIDDASVEELGRVQMWPRAFTARVVQHVSEGDPAAIGLDLLYTEPDTLPSYYATLLSEAGYRRPQSILRTLSTDDQFARTLAASDDTYLAFFDDPTRSPPDSLAHIRDALPTFQDASAAADEVAALTHPTLPIPSLRAAAQGAAPVGLPTTNVGMVRRYPAVHRLPAPDTARAATLVPGFSTLLAADVLEVPVSRLRTTANGVQMGTRRSMSTDARGRFRLNWLGEAESIRSISYHKVLRERIPSDFFEDKVVFIGASATALEDLKTTPVSRTKPGVAVHATAFLNLMNEAHLTAWTLWDLLPWLGGALIGILAVVVSVAPVYATLLTLGVAFVEFFGYVLYVFPVHDAVLPVGTLLLATLFAFTGGVLFKYLTEEWEKERLREAFASYVSDSLVERVAEAPEALELGGEKQRLTVLFSDIRNFTSYSEDLDPQEVVSYLNRYFDQMTAAVFEHNGTVDKFMGDGLMAIFGAPLQQENHADRACATALAMAHALDDLNARDARIEDGDDIPRAIAIGIGINTGDMVAGNIGSSQRFEYTVVGDAVNLGARLEPLNKRFGTRILVSESTYEAVAPAPWSFRNLGALRVKGRDHPVTIYELMDPATYDAPEALRKQFAEGLTAYHEQNVERARSAFEACLLLHPDDGPSAHYLDLCAQCEADPDRYAPVLNSDVK